MIVFLCAHVRISISTYIQQALLFTYRIGLHQVTPLGVVFLFMLVNWWVENINVFYSTFTNVFFNFCHVFKRFFNVFNCFMERFLHPCFTQIPVRILHALTMQYSIQKVLFLDFANAKSLITSSKSTERSTSASMQSLRAAKTLAPPLSRWRNKPPCVTVCVCGRAWLCVTAAVCVVPQSCYCAVSTRSFVTSCSAHTARLWQTASTSTSPRTCSLSTTTSVAGWSRTRTQTRWHDRLSSRYSRPVGLLRGVGRCPARPGGGGYWVARDHDGAGFRSPRPQGVEVNVSRKNIAFLCFLSGNYHIYCGCRQRETVQ